MAHTTKDKAKLLLRVRRIRGQLNAIVGNRLFLKELGVIPPEGKSTAMGFEVGIARDGQFLGALCLGDVLPKKAREAISALKSMGLKTILLTGDAGTVARSAAKILGVDEVGAELLPAQKVARVRELMLEGRTVVMVREGMNDAPALLEATVGVAMESGTEVTRESASVVLIGNDLSKFADTLRIARQCRRIILQNFTGTLVVDGIGIMLTRAGLLNPLLAALLYVSSELAFLLNSTRLIPAPRESQAGLAHLPS
jgi:P-type E1-E2 ATPase